MILGAALCFAQTNPIGAQTGPRADGDALGTNQAWTLSGDLAAVRGTTWLASTTAPTVKSGVGVSLAVGAQRALSARVRGGVAARVQRQPLRLQETDASWDGGTLTLGDVMGTLVLPVARAGGIDAELELTSGISLITGVPDLYPFSTAGKIAPTAGVGALLRRASRREVRTPQRQLMVLVRYEVIRVDPGPDLAARVDTFGGTAGWSRRISVGLRVHR